MSTRPRTSARPVESPRAPVTSPAASSAEAPSEAPSVDAALAARLADLEAKLAAANARADAAEAEALKAMEASTAPVATEAAMVRRAYLHHTSILFRGKLYEPAPGQLVPFPFDPQRPPEDVSGWFVEGVDYVYR